MGNFVGPSWATLLAQVDASIGGKTGINLPEGKNLVGVFWQPKAVVIDPEILQSLPDREFTSAMGEVIKYGAILDRVLFDLIEENIDDILYNNNKVLHCSGFAREPMEYTPERTYTYNVA